MPTPATRSSRTRRRSWLSCSRRYVEDGAAIADLARWLTVTGVPTRTGKSAVGSQRDLGDAAQPGLCRTRLLRQDHAHRRPARPQPGRPPGGPRHAQVVLGQGPGRQRLAGDPRSRRSWPRTPGSGSSGGWKTTNATPPATPRPRRCCRAWPPVRAADTPTTARPHDHHRRQQDLLLPVPRLRQLPLRTRPGLRQQAGPRRLPRPGRVGPHHRPARRPGS